MLKVVHDADAPNENGAVGRSVLDEIVRDDARRGVAGRGRGLCWTSSSIGPTTIGRGLVVRNGYHDERQVPRRLADADDGVGVVQAGRPGRFRLGGVRHRGHTGTRSPKFTPISRAVSIASQSRGTFFMRRVASASGT